MNDNKLKNKTVPFNYARCRFCKNTGFPWRAALCWNAEIAHLARQHNDANVLVMPGRFISTEEADMILTEFFSTKFDGGRHQNRIDKIPVK